MTRDELKKLSKEKLFEYFWHHARYSADSPTAPYSIRPGGGGLSLFSDDTMDIWVKFYRAIKGRPPKTKHWRH